MEVIQHFMALSEPDNKQLLENMFVSFFYVYRKKK